MIALNIFHRLPIVQGGTFTFVTPTIAIMSLEKWRCEYTEARKGKILIVLGDTRHACRAVGIPSYFKLVCFKFQGSISSRPHANKRAHILICIGLSLGPHQKHRFLECPARIALINKLVWFLVACACQLSMRVMQIRYCVLLKI